MIPLGRYPCIAVASGDTAGPEGHALHRWLPQAVIVPDGQPQTLGAAAARLSGDHVLVVPRHIRPLAALVTAVPEPAVLAAAVPLGFLAANAVTGVAARAPGPVLWPRARLAEAPADPDPPAVVQPVVAAEWIANPDPEAAFANGYRTASALWPAVRAGGDARDLLMAAVLGADRPFGSWWTMGVCHALLGSPPEAVAQEIGQVPALTPAPARERAIDLAREARVRTGLPVHPMTEDEAALFRRLYLRYPPPEAYLDFAGRLADLGGAGAARAAVYRQAAAWSHGLEMAPVQPVRSAL